MLKQLKVFFGMDEPTPKKEPTKDEVIDRLRTMCIPCDWCNISEDIKYLINLVETQAKELEAAKADIKKLLNGGLATCWACAFVDADECNECKPEWRGVKK